MRPEKSARLIEIYSSLQGEGPTTGTPMTFIRFQGCSIRCRWCDTPHSFAKNRPAWRLEAPPKSRRFRRQKNPVRADILNARLSAFDDAILSVTGGEPLEQAEFLAEWLPTVRGKKILLETAGIHFAALRKVIGFVDIVSMDFKLPSSAGTPPFWKAHRAFLETAARSGKETTVKIVVTPRTAMKEMERAAEIIRDVAPQTRVICQPVSPTPNFGDRIGGFPLARAEETLRQFLPNTQTLPQMHKIWGIL